MRTFVIQNFGCRASQADGAALESSLLRSGFGRAEAGGSPADFVILNTCTVTAAADDDVRKAVRRAHRENPSAKIIVTGCYAQRAPEEVAALPAVSMVVGNSHKNCLAELLVRPAVPFHGEIHMGEIHMGKIHVGDIFAQHEFLSSPVEEAGPDRSRPNLKIQDGCNNRCSFCVIPFVRGKSRSAPADQIVEQVSRLAERHAEVVLTGINLGRWGREPGIGMRLAGLLRRLLAETSIGRLRLSSVEPMDFSDDLLRLMSESPRIARHVHAPLQSGSDTVLRRMHRKYRPRHYEDRIQTARALMPDCAVGADVMAGFPGESAREFEETRAFIERLPFTYLHVFPYSERPGTQAAAIPAQVPQTLRRERVRILQELSARKNIEFRRAMAGRILSAVTLQNGLSAMTTNYLKVDLCKPRAPRELIEVEIGSVSEAGLRERALLPVLSW
ncbi:MAG: tRNA (N(6)-L-threonylcarbamoyladenosine(37)-C(2))-methylthiotransferase MtaB [Bryobacteraceae bacterium]